ncbi:MAG: sulfatase-like hydrolase/transferase [Lentisphaeria bacterium]|nr:sulfatase-like hydrolase/transferase [Lentisphaeria bacterium]
MNGTCRYGVLAWGPWIGRGGLLLLVAAWPLQAASAAQQDASAAPRASRPNILFLLSDDHSYPFVGCYGDTNVTTPNLDRLAAEGMRFHRFFTTAPQCVPSRSSLMTGRSPVAARITRFSSPLPRDEITFPEILRREAGYFVGVCGRSYHLDGSSGRGADGKVLDALLVQHGMKTFGERFDSVATGSDQVTAEQMAAFLDRKPEDVPFFLWVNYSDPHHVWNAADLAPDPASLRLPAHWPDLPGMRRQLADYCGEVNRLDGTVQRALELLDRRGFRDNTIVVFAGDNGGALPHGKGSLYDPGLNVPLIVRWPGVVRPGSESSALVSGEDLGPTLLAAAGVAVPERMSGVSFLALLRGGEAAEVRRYIFAERGPHGSAPVVSTMANSGYDLSRCVRSRRFKFIYNCTPWIPYSPVDSAGGPAWREIRETFEAGNLAPGLASTYFSHPRPVYELYDLDADPSELENLCGNPQYAETERELRLALAEKMILDFDYLPLPALGSRNADGSGAPQGRAEQFEQKDSNKDNRLSRAEFGAGREPTEAEKWFGLRDANDDGFLSREEFVTQSPLPKP